MKRLRFKFGSGIRYFQCGEYGEHYARPHHHAIIFGFVPLTCVYFLTRIIRFTLRIFWKPSGDMDSLLWVLSLLIAVVILRDMF